MDMNDTGGCIPLSLMDDGHHLDDVPRATRRSRSIEDVVTGETGHAEVVEILYDPNIVTYEELLEVFWRNIDPTDEGGQFVDRGKQYTTGIYYTSKQQKRAAELSKKKLVDEKLFSKKIVTKIVETKIAIS